MGKPRYYGIGTKQAIDSRNTASPNFRIEDDLTRSMVDGAIVALSIQNPGFDNLTTRNAADKIKTYLERRGFRGTLTAPSGKISDGTNTFALTHANNDNGQIVVARESHDNLDEKKKNGK